MTYPTSHNTFSDHPSVVQANLMQEKLQRSGEIQRLIVNIINDEPQYRLEEKLKTELQLIPAWLKKEFREQNSFDKSLRKIISEKDWNRLDIFTAALKKYECASPVSEVCNIGSMIMLKKLKDNSPSAEDLKGYQILAEEYQKKEHEALGKSLYYDFMKEIADYRLEIPSESKKD